MTLVTLIGIDLGKHSVHVHGQDRQGKALLRMKFSRKQLIEFLPTCLHGRDGSLCRCPLHGPAARRLWPWGQTDFPAIRSALRQEQEERLHRCRSYLRGSVSSIDAFRDAENRIATVPVGDIEKELNRQLQHDDLGQRLMSIPGVGPITASVLAAEVGDGKHYHCGRDFAASIGLVLRQYSTGSKNNLLGISKRGDKNIRRLLVQCARAYMQRLERQSDHLAQWVRSTLTRRHSNVVACALVNKPARTVWAIAAHHTQFKRQEAVMTAWRPLELASLHLPGFATTEIGWRERHTGLADTLSKNPALVSRAVF